jgi:hypothetical protein
MVFQTEFELIEFAKEMLISSPGTRFPRAVREASSALCACGVSLGHVFPQESRTLRSNQLCFTFYIELPI